MMRRDECVEALVRNRTDQIVVAVYHAAFDLLRVQPHPLNYLSVGAMGLASSHGLGLALGRPDRKVLVLDGDGSLLMNLGSLVTIAEMAPPNLVHFVFENGTYEANGGHPIPGRGVVDFGGFARAAGFANVREYDDLEKLEAEIDGVIALDGPTFVTLKVVPGESGEKAWDVIHGRQSRETFRATLNAAGDGSA